MQAVIANNKQLGRNSKRHVAILAFFDFCAAFPSVAHEWIFLVLQQRAVVRSVLRCAASGAVLRYTQRLRTGQTERTQLQAGQGNCRLLLDALSVGWQTLAMAYSGLLQSVACAIIRARR